MKARRKVSFSSRASGFSLIEVMVGLVISLIGTFAMMQAFAAFEAQKRTTTSGSDAQQSGSFSLYEMSRQIRTAGSALVQGRSTKYNMWGCSLTARSGGTGVMPLTAAPAGFAAAFAPVTLPLTVRALPALIYSGGVDGSGNALSDVISVISGNPAVRTFGNAIHSAAALQVVMEESAFGYYPGDYLLASNSTGNCVTGLSASVVDDATKVINLNAAASPVGGAPAPGFQTQTYLFDLGKNPIFTLFGVDLATQRLMAFDLLQRNGAANSLVEISDGIVLVKAVYGVDDGSGGGTANDGIIDAWVAPTGVKWGVGALTNGTPAAATAAAQIKAIRLAVVSRSQVPERASDFTNAGGLSLFADLPTAALHYPVLTDPQYRYKVYDTTIPLHNAAVNKIF